MFKLKNNNRNAIDFATNPDYEIEIRFNKWTKGKPPVTELIFDFIESDKNKEFEMIKAIYCDAAKSEDDPEVSKHLVLFIHEVKSVHSYHKVQQTNIDFQLNEKFRLVTIRYFINEKPPSENDINCDFYYKTLEDIENTNNDLGIPDVHKGGFIIKR